jgi:preprotein translocase subunit SecB
MSNTIRDDETPQAQDETAAGGDEAETAPSELVMTAQFLKDLSFENPNAPQVLARIRERPDMNVSVDVMARPLGQNAYEVALSINAKATFGDAVGFIAELHYGGVCVAPELPDEDLERMLLIDGPTLLFPYARAILSDATREGGFPPLYLTPINFARLYESRRKGDATTSTGQVELSGAPAAP